MRGEGTACRDETVVYTFASLPAKPAISPLAPTRSWTAKPLTWERWNSVVAKLSAKLMCEYAPGAWRLKVTGDNIEETLTRPDNAIFRKVTVHKERVGLAGYRRSVKIP
ncbi:MAG: hypothetical protein QOJ99_2557 [Bryobacterales bacterium]|nr:hypothetical protein [Bryobacterales bacterium]